MSYEKTSFKSILSQKSLLLRGTKLKNTEWVVGLTVYTGTNTKIMKNGCAATSKVSNIEEKVNKIILFVLLFEVLCCAFSAIFCYIECLNYNAFESMITQTTEVNCS